jgi:hypothetical protein
VEGGATLEDVRILPSLPREEANDDDHETSDEALLNFVVSHRHVPLLIGTKILS